MRFGSSAEKIFSKIAVPYSGAQYERENLSKKCFSSSDTPAAYTGRVPKKATSARAERIAAYAFSQASGVNSSSLSRNMTYAPRAFSSPVLRAAIEPLFCSCVNTRIRGSSAASRESLALVRSSDPSSTQMISMLRSVWSASERRHRASVSAVLYTGTSTETAIPPFMLVPLWR